MITVPSKRFYVYTLNTPDGTPFYVGKGTSSRLFHHIQEAFRNTCDCCKCGVIRGIWASGKDIQHNVVSEFDDEESAYRAEYELISMIGQDRLVNIMRGWKFTESGSRPSTQVLKYETWGRGTILQRKDGRWMVSVGFTLENGKHVRKYAYARTKEVAEVKLEKLKRLRDELVKAEVR